MKDFPAYISKPEATELIAQQAKSVYSKDDPMRMRKNKIDRLLQTRIDNGKIATDEKGRLCFNDIAIEMQNKFPGCFDHWPREITTKISASFNPSCSSSYCFFPKDVDECHRIIIILQATIKTLQLENEQLRPEAERHMEVRSINRDNAKKKRKDM